MLMLELKSIYFWVSVFVELIVIFFFIFLIIGIIIIWNLFYLFFMELIFLCFGFSIVILVMCSLYFSGGYINFVVSIVMMVIRKVFVF